MGTILKPAARWALQCMEIQGGNHAANTRISTPGLDLWVVSQPHDQAADGGDVHYVSLCGAGAITRFIVADVAGHGAAVADVARALRTLMRRHINRKSQAKLVQGMNRQFAGLAELGRFATAVVATYRTTGDKLTVCNAGYPHPLWYRAASRQWSVLATAARGPCGPVSNLPLGIDHTACYDQVEVVLGRGDLILFYTDALTEATNVAGQPLGEAGLLDLVRALDTTDPTRLASSLVRALDDYRGGKPPADDLTFLLLHHNAGHPPRFSFRQTLDVYAKVLGFKPM